MRSILLAVLLASNAMPAVLPPTTPAQDAVNSAQSALLQADGRRARDLLADIPTDALDPGDARFRDCALGRLDGPIAPETPISPLTGRPDDCTRQVLVHYRDY